MTTEAVTEELNALWALVGGRNAFEQNKLFEDGE